MKEVCAHLELQIPTSAKKAVLIEEISEHLELESEDNPEHCDTDETWKFRLELEIMKLEYAREEREKEREEREKQHEEREKEREMEERIERERSEHELELKKLEYIVNHDKSSGFNFYSCEMCAKIR